jgi:hypothetical protein
MHSYVVNVVEISYAFKGERRERGGEGVRVSDGDE